MLELSYIRELIRLTLSWWGDVSCFRWLETAGRLFRNHARQPTVHSTLHRILQLLPLQDKLRDDTIFAGPDPGSDAFLSGSRTLDKSGPRNLDEHPGDLISESLETIFWVKNTSILYCGSGIFQTLDPG